MSDSVIKVTGLGKRYQIVAGPGHGGLYDRVGRVIGRRRPGEEEAETVWALRDISFEVAPGHIVGVMGRNGSGKSTLMKILARVTVPTEGCATVRGRVGALLQVGIGFHPELSGRDNIYLSGSIIGASRRDIDARRDEIVEFAEIGRFLDTPVKHYSSGMFMRLAFSVSSHLISEVMLVDEVLAVGDAAFRKKCEDRIRTLVREGRTVMLVSHDVDSVIETCDSAIVLHEGALVHAGNPLAAADFYEREILQLPLEKRKSAKAAALMQ